MAKKVEAQEEVKVKVKIRPLRGIGGYGDAGWVGLMPKSEAEYYVKEGYVDVIEAETPEVVPSEAAEVKDESDN